LCTTEQDLDLNRTTVNCISVMHSTYERSPRYSDIACAAVVSCRSHSRLQRLRNWGRSDGDEAYVHIMYATEERGLKLRRLCRSFSACVDKLDEIATNRTDVDSFGSGDRVELSSMKRS
jgi:hypothetical protein